MPNLKEWLADRRITLYERTPQGAVAELAAESCEHMTHMASLANVVSKPMVKDNGPVIDNRHAPKPVLRDTRGIRVRTMASKLGDARLGAARRGLEHSQGRGDSVQAICHDPARDYVDMHGAFVALRDIDVKALPPKLRRVYERAKHRASVANNGKPD